MSTSTLLLFILKWPATKIEKKSKSLKTLWMESIYAIIRLQGDGKVGFSETHQNLQKMGIIDLGGPKCYTISESSHPLGLPIRGQIGPKWSGKLMPEITRWLKFDSETFLGFHPKKSDYGFRWQKWNVFGT